VVNSRAKGKRGELEFAKFCRDVWGFQGARRTQQFCGSEGDGDVVVPGLAVHFEVKRPKTLPMQIKKYMNQAVCDAASGSVPLVVMREDGGPWLALVQATHLQDLCERVAESECE
jgi:hypothetical protein